MTTSSLLLINSSMEWKDMTSFKRTLPALGLAALLSLALAACGESGPEQQSSAPSSEQPGDAAAVPQSPTEEPANQNQ